MLETLKKIQAIIDKMLVFVIIVLFLLMFGITNLNVIMRYCFNMPITFSVEMGRYCFVSIIFLGAIFTTKEDRHIQVDFFTGLFPEKIRCIIEQFGRVLMAVFFAILTFYTCRMALANVKVVSSAMQIPMAIPYSVMAFGSAGIVLESVVNIIQYQLGYKHKKRGIEEDL
ncbi:MAG: TRAP transporter small permease [Lachnospiraceae bacterium]|nr:TRAP transporter small permease [Lachnospiraceae bacterium]